MSNLPDIANNFDEFIRDGVVVVDFWAAWCGPCRMLAPIFEDVSAKLSEVKFGKVDVDNAPEFAKRFHVSSIPNVCIFKNGELADRVIGLCDEEELTETISKHL